jgi:hypothetical protein
MQIKTFRKGELAGEDELAQTRPSVLGQNARDATSIKSVGYD